MAYAFPDLAVSFIDHYDEALTKRFQDSELFRHRDLLHFAPIFLAKAIADTDKGRPEGIMTTIEQMRSEVTEDYRSLCSELLEADQQNALRIFEKIELLLDGLALRDEGVPRVRGTVARGIVASAKFLGPISKIIQGDEETVSEVVDTIGNIADQKDSLKNVVDEVAKRSIYVGLSFFNRIHKDRADTDSFYSSLKGVFYELDFSQAELDKYLAGTSVRTIYSERRSFVQG